MIRNIILDWSGTVADDMALVLDATNALFRRHGRAELSREEFRTHFRLPFTGFYEEMLPGVATAEIERLYHEYFIPGEDGVTLLPGARDFLTACRAGGRRLFLLSTIHPRHWATQSVRLDVAGFFERAEVGVLDKRERIGALLAEAGLRPAETVFVGDMVHDLETARAAGVLGVAVLTGYDALEKLAAAQPDAIVPDLQALGRLLLSGDAAGEAQEALYARPLPAVGALIFDPTGREVLLLRTRKWSDRWGIPGGKIRRGETALEALHREVREETGLELEPDSVAFVHAEDCIDPAEFERPAHFLLLAYRARARSREVTLNDEAQAFNLGPGGESAAGEAVERALPPPARGGGEKRGIADTSRCLKPRTPSRSPAWSCAPAWACRRPSARSRSGSRFPSFCTPPRACTTSATRSTARSTTPRFATP